MHCIYLPPDVQPIFCLSGNLTCSHGHVPRTSGQPPPPGDKNPFARETMTLLLRGLIGLSERRAVVAR